MLVSDRTCLGWSTEVGGRWDEDVGRKRVLVGWLVDPDLAENKIKVLDQEKRGAELVRACCFARSRGHEPTQTRLRRSPL